MQTRFQKLPDVETSIARLAALYAAAGPRLGCVLVEADMLLVLAELRGQSQTPLFEPTEEDAQQMQELSSLLGGWGMRWRLFEPQSHPTGRQCAVFMLENLVGYSYVSRRSRMTGVTPLDPESGWEGYQTWKDATKAAMLAHYKDEDSLGHRWLGLAFGYPDIAIEDACRAAREGRPLRTFARADLPAVARYGGAQPCFSFEHAHKWHPDILATVATWEHLLQGVYASDWHQRISQDTAFKTARHRRNGCS